MSELIRINRQALAHKLHLRGKSRSSLRAVVSGETVVRIFRGEPVSPRSLEKIMVQLLAWPEPDGAADRVSAEGDSHLAAHPPG